MPKVFLSYRRADPLPNWQVRRIGRMCGECGFEEVFVDRDAGAIPPGSNYRQEIERAVRASDVVLVLIGEKWQSLLDAKREDANDMVRFEIHLGLSLGKKVVPVLLGGSMPGLADLPEDLREFHFCNGQSFEPDTMDSLLPLLLKGLAGESEAQPRATQEPHPEPAAPPNPLQDFAARARQRADEEAQRHRNLEERRKQWTEQFEQFQELRQNPHLSVAEIREALETLCRHWHAGFPEDWDGREHLEADWEAGHPVVTAGWRLPREEVFDLGSEVRMPFCFIPAGSFEREGNLVTLTRDFWMAKYPVTQGEWTAIMGSHPSQFAGAGDRAPLEPVSWKEAQMFLSKVGPGFGLPTEAEWEYACRAGTRGDYNVEGVSLDALGWYAGNSGETTHPVGEKRPNGWGLHDMHGNVWELCQDWFGEYPKGPVTDPAGAEESGERVIRGGGWFYEAEFCRSGTRFSAAVDLRSNNLGFRLVRREF